MATVVPPAVATLVAETDLVVGTMVADAVRATVVAVVAAAAVVVVLRAVGRQSGQAESATLLALPLR